MNISTYVYDMKFWKRFREVNEQWEWEDYDDFIQKYYSIPEIITI